MRPSLQGLPSTYLSISKDEQIKPKPFILERKETSTSSTIALPRKSIVDTPFVDGTRQPITRRTSVFQPTPLGGPIVNEMNKNEKTIVIKNVPAYGIESIIQKLQTYGKMDKFEIVKNGDLKVTFSNSKEAQKVIRKGLIESEQHSYYINGIKENGKEYGCGDVVKQTSKTNQTWWDYIKQLFGYE
ncbi:RRM domain-containing protein [Entamoeba marina]